MVDLTMTRLHEAIVVLYAIGIIFYFIDYLKKDVKSRRIAFWFVSIVWVLQSIFLIIYMYETHRFPILTLFEGIYFYSWLLVSISILLHCIYRVDLPVFFINIIGFVFMVIHTFAPNQLVQSPVGQDLLSELLLIHIIFAILSYVAFSLSFVFSVLYTILYNVLKKKKWTKQWTRLPSLQQAESSSTWSIIIGVPILFISLVLGLMWAYVTVDNLNVFDIKIMGSIISLLAYCIIIVLNRNGKLRSTKYAWANIYAFLFIIINFFLGSSLSGFHFWY
ncbi:cytochrome C assembly family protein [Kurthia sibirica]|uniref:Cytochrome C assembly protein n=1 Tax=Kurthia sibirica TaxID=202750 RepID=A0A2U3ANI3_9BACL|nr:cytochrome c biogenesis protein CcsA [Kurthia sibirica]PWI26092.1 cytochrome C assembly protein [Kurthia sibirica]GEK34930.1 protein HemX [Kurthia sibirica]